MPKYIKKSIILVFGLLYSVLVTAKPNTLIVDQSLNKNLFNFSDFYHDKTKNLKIDQIVNIGTWSSEVILSDSLETQSYWFEFSLENKLTVDQNFQILIKPVFIEKSQLYDERGTLVGEVGSMLESESFQVRQTILSKLEPGVHKYYLNIMSRSNRPQIRIEGTKVMQVKQMESLILFSITLGGLISLVFYHLFLWFGSKDKSVLDFLLFLSAASLFIFSYSFAHNYFIPKTIMSLDLGFYASALVVPFFTLSMYTMTKDLVGYRADTPLKKLIYIIPILSATSLLGMVFSDNMMFLSMMRLSIALTVFSLPIISAFSWFKDKSNKVLLVITISLFTFSVGAVVELIMVVAADELSQYSSWVIPISSIIQAMGIAIALGMRLKSLQIMNKNSVEKLSRNLEKLKKRDQVIRSFVSPTILGEIDNGLNPMQFTPENEYVQ